MAAFVVTGLWDGRADLLRALEPAPTTARLPGFWQIFRKYTPRRCAPNESPGSAVMYFDVKISAALLRAMLVALFLTGLTPLVASAQGDEVPAELPASPLQLLLEHRGPLELTSEQVGDLEQIRERLASTNDPLVQRMMNLRRQWQQERRAARNGREQAPARLEGIRAQAERIRERIQQNNRAAMQRVNRMLTPPQRKQLRTIVQERRQQNPGRRARGAPSADGND
jgi:LTXXQ motif family protein